MSVITMFRVYLHIFKSDGFVKERIGIDIIPEADRLHSPET